MVWGEAVRCGSALRCLFEHFPAICHYDFAPILFPLGYDMNLLSFLAELLDVS